MTDPAEQAATQLRNVIESTGLTVADFTASVRSAGLDKHGQIVKHLKSAHGLTHGNANLVAHKVRDELAGGPPPEDDLLGAQYSGAKAALRPIYDELATIAMDTGDDVTQAVQKTGVSFRRKKQFALVQVPSSKRVQLGLNLDETPDDVRVREVSGMCSHRIDLADVGDVDDEIARWIRASYDRAG